VEEFEGDEGQGIEDSMVGIGRDAGDDEGG
jgi:hypothetical protein